jgi:uncharacterized protein (DUF433 family)
MKHFEPIQAAPLVLGEDGTIRIRGSRVTLDSVIDQFKQGATAEQIQEDFPSLTLRDVYGTIAYYLDHIEEIDRYLREQAEAGEVTRQSIEAQQDLTSLRKRIRERRGHLVK